jgi:5'-nucleotidase
MLGARVRILISNDDGIYAPGIRALAMRLAAEPDYDVYVCAPDRERSATGHALTLHKPLRVQEVEIDSRIKGSWYTTGTPSDCVKFAVGALLGDQTPDFVVSGINSGPNLGGEILYSGTVSAAMEGAFLDIPSVAVSAQKNKHENYEIAAEYIAHLLRSLKKVQFMTGKTLLNVNVPMPGEDGLKGVRIAKLGVRAYNDYFEKRTDPRGKVYYWLAGEAIEEGEEENTDAWCVHHKIISITPITFNMTDFKLMDTLKTWGELPGIPGITTETQSGQAPIQTNPKQATDKR